MRAAARVRSTGDPSTAFWPRLGLVVRGPKQMALHLTAEYGPPTAAAAEADLVIEDLARAGARASARAGVPGSVAGSINQGRYKTTRWRTRLSSASTDPITCGLAIRGLFGRSLVQSIVLEPLLSIAMAGHGRALVSAAGVLMDGQAVLIVGASRSGKSTIALRAWAAGHELLGDDRVIITEAGRVAGFRRRLRLYPDLTDTAPLAVRRLGRAIRRQLALGSLIRRISGGFVGLPVLVDPDLVGIDPERQVPIGSLVVIQRVAPESRAVDPHRAAEPGSADIEPALARVDDPETAWAEINAILGRDLAWVRAQGPEWATRAERTRHGQLEVLRAAIRTAGADVYMLRVPGAWTAPRAIAAVAEQLGLDR